ncbi:MAG TPA: CBS and ACT domain-containing protein [Anaerolineae bacterium]|nr:CBS and ACT domain-containing protein [Anaerolineae bacterium]
MSSNPVTIGVDTGITEALRVMRERQVRRLPVLDDAGRLMGIVSEKDLLYASPSPATSLSIYEMHYVLSRLKVSEVMTAEVITVAPDTLLEEAATIMVDNKIGGLPVVQDGKLVGIITETDVFKVFLELLGGREHGLRLTVEIPERKGEIARLTTEIARLGGNILALGTFLGDDPTTAVVMVKVEGVSASALADAMEDLDLEILDSEEV